ncbi:WRKY11 [Artemisia annua]|uniref:WRKY11 n=1 Tax=Artemisia annua TaxID=35608 RepID=A0A2U1MAH9_ARTAN|nr:WRKY11 [Artemisia annua]
MVLLAIRSNTTNKYFMESSSTWPDNLLSNRIKAIQELTQGKHLTIKLRELLEQPEKIESDRKSVDGVVAQILGMFENTLSALNSSSNETFRIPTTVDTRSPRSSDDQKSEDSSESVKTITPLKTKRGCYKRRRNASTCTKVTSTLIDDGYAWRKYGQKAILAAKHQRNYFRCTHRFDQGCQATKQVQKTDDEPPKYKTTYNGHHTCKKLQKVPQIILDSPNPRDNSILINFGTNTLTENTQAGPCFNSMITQTPKNGLPSKVLKHDQDSSCDHYTARDPIVGLSQVPSDPMSMMSSELDHEDMMSSGVFSSTSSTNGYEIDDMLGSNDFGDFPFELC